MLTYEQFEHIKIGTLIWRDWENDPILRQLCLVLKMEGKDIWLYNFGFKHKQVTSAYHHKLYAFA